MLEISLRRRKFVGKGSGGILPRNTLKSRGSEMVFSTFSMSFFSKKINAIWVGCKMTGTSSAYSMYLLLKQKHFSSRKLGWLTPRPRRPYISFSLSVVIHPSDSYLKSLLSPLINPT